MSSCGPDHDGCITCGDVGTEMTVLEIDESRGLALCEDSAGSRETVEIGLVDAGAGERVLVHAATAIASLKAPA